MICLVLSDPEDFLFVFIHYKFTHEIFISIPTLKGIEPSGMERVSSSITIKGTPDGRLDFVAASTVDAISAAVITAFALDINSCREISSGNFY